MYNFVGSNEIGKGTVIEEQVCADKYIKVGDNCYVGPNCVITSHLVEGIFGNIPYFQPRLGDNVTLGGLNCIGPATYLDDNTYVFPLSSGSKFNKLKGKNYYFGLPFRKIFKKKVAEYLDITQEDLIRAKELEKKQIEAKKEGGKAD
jgi:UDP-3-O-[3-hydroxymyristoyl] glucosamine N-acyltransferase